MEVVVVDGGVGFLDHGAEFAESVVDADGERGGVFAALSGDSVVSAVDRVAASFGVGYTDVSGRDHHVEAFVGQEGAFEGQVVAEAAIAGFVVGVEAPASAREPVGAEREVEFPRELLAYAGVEVAAPAGKAFVFGGQTVVVARCEGVEHPLCFGCY